jgi:hypothetical protein
MDNKEYIPYCVLLVGQSLDIINHFRPMLLPAATQSHGLQHVQGLLYIQYTVSLLFEVFADTSKGLLTCIQDTVNVVMSVMALQFL